MRASSHRRALTRLLLAALLLLQWGTAFAHCLRLAAPPDAGAADWHLPICTADGLKTLPASALGAASSGEDEPKPSGGGAVAMGACPACHALHAAGELPAPPTLAEPAVLLMRVRDASPSAPPPPQPRRTQPPPRAPPIS